MADGVHTFTYTDFGGEKSAVRIRGAELTAANFDAQVLASVALQDAIAGIAIGLKGKVTYANENQISAAKASNEYAQRETKWLVSYHDNITGDKYTLEIPCANLSLLEQDTGDVLALSGTEAAAFKTAFEGFAVSKNGNSCVVDRIVHVGRNN